MHAPLSTPDGLPARAAIIIIGCLLVVLAALWLFILTKTMIVIGVGALALLIAGACAFAHRHTLKPM
jgi:hypothetical protein